METLTLTFPGPGSTAGFLGVVAIVLACAVGAVRRAVVERALPTRATGIAIAALALLLATSATLAESGVFALAAGTRGLAAYPAFVNGLVIVIALSSLGRRVATAVPIWALVAFQGFRLPLELVLHAWYEAGALPVQMTFEGDNFDIATGILGLAIGLGMRQGWLGLRAAWVFNLIGCGLLVRVMQIALLSSPWPARVYMNDPPVLLMFHAPYTWILPICVSGALMGHLLLFRALLAYKSAVGTDKRRPVKVVA